MKLIDGGRAPNPRRVRIFLKEKGIEVPAEPIDLGKGAHLTEDFARLNPMRRVPVLVLDDGTAIAESVAICRYFEVLSPDPPLFGADAREQALVEMWNRRVELNLFGAITNVFRHLHPAMATLETPQVREWGEANRPKVPAHLSWLNGELRGRDFIAGPRFSIADITAVVALDFMKPARLDMPEGLDDLARWRERVSSRPSMTA